LFVALFPWAARNHTVLGRWIWSTTNSGITQYDGLNPEADGSSNQKFVERMPELKQMGEVERGEYLAGQAKDFARNNPAKVLKLAMAKIARTWSPIPLSSEYRSRMLIVLVAAIYSIPLDLLVVWALWFGKLPRAAKVFLMIPALY